MAVDGMKAAGRFDGMEQKHPEQRITTTKISSEPLGELLSVYEALRSGDEAQLTRLWQKTQSAEDFSELIRVAVAHDSYPILSRGVVKAHEHAALWMMPVLLDAMHGGSVAVDMGMQRWLQSKVSGGMQKVVTIETIPTLAAIFKIQPTQLQGLLGMLLRRNSPGVSMDLHGEATPIDEEARVPTLRFLVGAISRLNDDPELPSIDEIELRKFALRLAIQGSPTSSIDTSMPDSVRVGQMLPFRDAVVAGVLMWLEDVGRKFEIVGWSLEPRLSLVNLTLELVTEEGDHVVCGLPMPLWEVGSEGVAAIAQRCSEWKFRPELLSSVVLPSRLS